MDSERLLLPSKLKRRNYHKTNNQESMAATKYGSGNYGIASESSKGIYIQSLSISVSEDVAELATHLGEVEGIVMYNQNATITGNGATVTANDTGQTIGGILSINNTGLYGVADTTGISKFYVESVEVSDSNTEFQQGSFTARGFINITASSGSEVTGP